MDLFLSYNARDKEVARALASQLSLAGAYVWFDEWEVRAGDSIPGRVNEALASVEALVLLWSKNANRSRWVRAELEAAITRSIDEGSFRVVPIRLDATPLPSLLRPLRSLDGDTDMSLWVNEILGFGNDQQRLKAIQEALDAASIDVAYYHGYGPVVCCPRCGADLNQLEPWTQTDYKREDTYAGFRCKSCGFTDGSEIW